MTLRKPSLFHVSKKRPTCGQTKTTTCSDITLRNKKNLFKLPDNFESGFDHHMSNITFLKILRALQRKKCVGHIKTWIVLIMLRKLNFIASEKIIPLHFLKKQALLKAKLLRYSNKVFMSMKLRKSIKSR